MPAARDQARLSQPADAPTAPGPSGANKPASRPAGQGMRGGAGAGSGGGGAAGGGGRGIEVVQPGGPRPYTSPKGVNWGRPPAPRGGIGEGAVTPGGPKPFVSPRSEQWGRPPAPAGKTPAAEPGPATPRSAAPAKPAKQTPPSEDDIRQALKTQKEQQRREIDLPHQDARVQRMAKTLHNENEMPMVDKREALEQLTDTRSSRTAKQAPKDVQEAIINTREQKLYKPADQATINQVSKNPAVQKMMKPGDKLVMDSFQTPGKSGRSVGADRDARLVIQRADGKRIEVPLLRLTGPPWAQPGEDALATGLRELTEAQLVKREGDTWAPTETLHRLAAYWTPSLPAVAHEVVTLDGDNAMRQYKHCIALRGGGPLWLIDFDGLVDDLLRATLRSLDGKTYLETITALVQPPEMPVAEPAQEPSDEPAPKPAGASLCASCGAPLQPNQGFCSKCGTRVQQPQPRTCPNPACCKPLREGAKFCAACGTRIA